MTYALVSYFVGMYVGRYLPRYGETNALISTEDGLEIKISITNIYMHV